jgi:hypothetical protein
MERTDNSYCGVVNSAREFRLRDNNGLPPGERSVFRIQYVTLSDDSELEFVPNLGFTRYSFHHHGSIADTDVRLTEFHRGDNA